MIARKQVARYARDKKVWLYVPHHFNLYLYQTCSPVSAVADRPARRAMLAEILSTAA